MTSYIKLNRTTESQQLVISKPKAFLLLTVIAMRARRKADKCLSTDLEQNQARVGDYRSCGLTRQEYRTALLWLKSNHLITTEATTKGTIATLLDSRIYDINPECNNHQSNQKVTIEQPSSNHQATTKKNDKKEKKVRNKDKHGFLDLFNSITGRKFRIMDEKTKRQLSARLKEGFTIDEIKTAIENCMKSEYHKDHPEYLTPEFITRSDKLQKYMNMSGSPSVKKMPKPAYIDPNDPFGLKKKALEDG